MVARCKTCKLPWNVSVKADLSEEYECPKCEAKRKRALVEPKPIVKPKKRDKRKNRNKFSKVLMNNKQKFSL